MPWCPNCRTEYEVGTTCVDCGAALVPTLPPEDFGDEPVNVLEAVSSAESDIAVSTLRAEGIPAFSQPPTVVVPGDSIVDHGSPDLDVLVPADMAARAREILSAPPISEEELAELEESEEPDEEGETGGEPI